MIIGRYYCFCVDKQSKREKEVAAKCKLAATIVRKYWFLYYMNNLSSSKAIDRCELSKVNFTSTFNSQIAKWLNMSEGQVFCTKFTDMPDPMNVKKRFAMASEHIQKVNKMEYLVLLPLTGATTIQYSSEQDLSPLV